MVDAVPSAPSAWNLANMLTVLRIVLVPFFAWALLADGGHSTSGRLIATGIFAFAAATDRMDGWLARRQRPDHRPGQAAGPDRRQALIGTALVLLSWLGDLPWWITVIILVREIGITVMRLFLLRYVVLPASRGGKIKTVLQSVAIGLYLLPLDVMPDWVTWAAIAFMAAALVVTVVTGIDYVRAAVQIRRVASRPPHAGTDRPMTTTTTTTPPPPRRCCSPRWAGRSRSRSRSPAGWCARARRRARRVREPARGRRLLRHRPQGHAARRRRTLLAARGAVDPEVARQMADGVRDRLGADVGLATTGVAGPDAQDGHAPGTVHVAVAHPSA